MNESEPAIDVTSATENSRNDPSGWLDDWMAEVSRLDAPEFIPTPAQILADCRIIQATWSEVERLSRAGKRRRRYFAQVKHFIPRRGLPE